MNKEKCHFPEKRQCLNCRKIISNGFIHYVNRYLTYYFCDEICFNDNYGQKTKEDGSKL